jgi:transposase
MRTPGTAAELERRRRLAVERVLEGYSQQEVAEFLGISKGTLSGWMKAYREGGWSALACKPHPGRPRRLTSAQEQQVLGWFTRSPTEFGFPNELWTAKRVAQVIAREFSIRFCPRYLSQWLAARRITPQKPRRQPRERNEPAIQAWLRSEWPRLKNGRRTNVRIWC